MRTQVSWSLALMALVMSGSLATGCKSSTEGRKPGDGGREDGAIDGDGGVEGGTPGTPGFSLSRTSGLQTDESGKTDTFTLALTSRPSADVTVGVTSNDESEGKVSPAQLVFTPVDWASPHTVTVTGQNDDDQDGPQQYKVSLGTASSTDGSYNGKVAGEVTATNVDDDTAGVTVVGAEALTTYEPDLAATFQLKLNTEPTGDVLITLTSQDLGEVTVAPATLTFTPDNWNALQDVTLKGVDDAEVDGAQVVLIKGTVTSTADERYNDVTFADVTVTNRDDETAGVIVEPTSGLRTFEDARGQDQFVVFLNTRPTSNVEIGVSSDTPTEALASTQKLTFTPDNWNAPQTVYVSGVNDDVPDHDQEFSIVLAAATSADPRFANVNPADVSGLNIDDESANVVIDDEQLFATEGGDPASFTISLTTAPTADVTIPLGSLTTEQATVAPASVTFTSTNWNAKQVVVVTAVNDPIADGSQTVTVDLAAATSTDVRYAGLDAANVAVSVVDNDSPGFDVDSIKLTTNESGETGSFAVKLLSRPTQTVTLPVASDKPAEITLDTASLVFTVDNWNSPHIVTLTGVEDNLIDGDARVEISLGPTTSGDAGYAGKTLQPLVAKNVDNDAAGLALELPAGGLVTREDGTTASFKVALLKPPAKDVTFTVSVSRPLEASIDVGTLTFTPEDWSGKQTLTLTGLPDSNVSDGDQDYEVVFSAAVSDDANYKDYLPARIPAKNIDNDTAGILPSVTGGLATYEDQTQASAEFEVSLRSRPEPGKTVELTITSDAPSEGIATPATLTFNENDWSSPKTITVKGVQDDRTVDGNKRYTVLVTSTSEDAKYAGKQASVSVLNIDDDSAGYAFTGVPSGGSLDVSEDGETETFSLSLTSRPTQTVRIQVASTRETEGKVSPSFLEFTPTDWGSLHTVTVTGQGDLVKDGTQGFFVEFSAVEGAPEYTAIALPPRVAFENVDRDGAGLEIRSSDLVTSEAGKTGFINFRVNQRPNAVVTILATAKRSLGGSIEGAFDPSVRSDDPESTAVLTFGGAGNVTEQTLTLYGVNDDVADGDQPYKIVFAPAVSDDPAYAGRVIPTINDARNLDNDIPGVLVSDITTPFETTESGSLHGTLKVSLRTQPVGTVRVPITVSKPGEVTVSPTFIDFDANNWNGVETVEVYGRNEDEDDGDQAFTVNVGPVAAGGAPSDANYVGQRWTGIEGVALDDDSAGVVVNVISSNQPISDLRTGEPGRPPASATFTVKLNTRPTGPVKINITSTNELEGTVDKGTLTFTSATPDMGPASGSYAIEQTVTVTGFNDDVDDGTKSYFIDISAPISDDVNYAALTGRRLSAENRDDDTAAWVVTRALPFGTKEPNLGTSFTLRPATQPKAPVTVTVSSLDTDEVTVTPDTLFFDASNWQTPLPITVNAVDDSVDDGDQGATLVLARPVSDDPEYAALPSELITLLNEDDDSAGFDYDGFSGARGNVTTYETGVADTFTVKLHSQPLGEVRLPITIAGNAGEATVTPELVFTPTNWNTPQTVTVTPINDRVLDHPSATGTKTYQVSFGQAVSPGDPLYVRTPPVVTGTSWEAPRSCLELLNTTTVAPLSGTYWLDTDVQGAAPPFRGYCDMVTSASNGSSTLVGGWTLLAWTRTSDETGGLPYPGDERPALDIASLLTEDVGSGVPAEALDALFATSSQLAQGQTITASALTGFPSFKPLKDYEFAGTFNYGSLAGLTRGNTFLGCTPLKTGKYEEITDASAVDLTGTDVFLNQSLLSNFPGGASVWSIGNRTGYCATNGTAPASFVGTWQEEQYGPRQQSAVGAYSVWVR
jgi:large repetitive protein